MKLIYYLSYYAFAIHLPALGRWKMVGKISTAIRRFICNKLFAKTTGSFSVGKGVDFGYLGHLITLENYANLGNYLKIKGNGELHVGKHVMMGDDVTIITENHRYLKPKGYDGYIIGKVTIGDYVWIGDRVIILQGVTIGEHSVIGAGSIVTKDIPSYVVAAGNPAKVINIRNK